MARGSGARLTEAVSKPRELPKKYSQGDLAEHNADELLAKAAKLPALPMLGKFAHDPAASLPRVDMRGALARGLHLEEGHLYLDATRAELNDSVLIKVGLTHSVFDGAKAYKLKIKEAVLREVSFRGAKLKVSMFEGADLRHADLREANLQDVTFAKGTDLTYVRFSHFKPPKPRVLSPHEEKQKAGWRWRLIGRATADAALTAIQQGDGSDGSGDDDDGDADDDDGNDGYEAAADAAISRVLGSLAAAVQAVLPAIAALKAAIGPRVRSIVDPAHPALKRALEAAMARACADPAFAGAALASGAGAASEPERQKALTQVVGSVLHETLDPLLPALGAAFAELADAAFREVVSGGEQPPKPALKKADSAAGGKQPDDEAALSVSMGEGAADTAAVREALLCVVDELKAALKASLRASAQKRMHNLADGPAHRGSPRADAARGRQAHAGPH